MGAFYMLRAMGDVGAEFLSLISPLGLILRAEAYASNSWWPVFVMLCIAIPITLIAFRLNLTRDIDQGFLPDKQGKAESKIKSAFGLAIKLSKTGIIVGIITIFAIGASYGAIMGDIDGFIEANEFYRQLILWMDGISLPVLFAGMINFMAAMIALIPMLLYMLRARGEEKDIRAELILATPVCRYRYLGGYAIIAFGCTIVFQSLAAVGLWMSAVSVLPDPTEFPLGTIITANLVYLPAIWVVLGLAIFLIGVLPKLTGLIWAVYGAIFLLGMFGRMDIFPAWLINISPFGFIPQYPMESISVLSMIVLVAIAVGLAVIGFVGFRSRDVGVK